MTAPLRLLLSPKGAARWTADIGKAMEGRPHEVVTEGDAEIAFVTRDVTSTSTKHELMPETKRFYDLMRAAQGLRWVHTHSAGADRGIFQELMARGVQLTTSSGANAEIVAQTALAGILALTRQFPQLMRAQAERRWASLFGDSLPRDLGGQRLVLVGWGPIGQSLARSLGVLGVRVSVVRHSDTPAGDLPTVRYGQLADVLGDADWLVVACPLSKETRGLVGAREFAAMRRGARFVNVARGEVVQQAALIEALASGHLSGAYLDVFEHEPLPAESVLWGMENVIVTPHSAGISAGNQERVGEMFLENLRRWTRGDAMVNSVA